MKRKKLSVEQEKYKVTMSVYYDLYTSGNPQKKEEQQALYARVIPSGTIDADKFVELVSKSNGLQSSHDRRLPASRQ